MVLSSKEVVNILPKEYLFVKRTDSLINGQRYSCTVFIQHGDSTVYVRVRAEEIVVKTVRDKDDYVGGAEHVVELGQLADKVASLLKVPHVAV